MLHFDSFTKYKTIDEIIKTINGSVIKCYSLRRNSWKTEGFQLGGHWFKDLKRVLKLKIRKIMKSRRVERGTPAINNWGGNMLNNFNIKGSIDIESIDDVILIQRNVKCFFEISKRDGSKIVIKTFGDGNEKYLPSIHQKIAGNKSIKCIIADFLLSVEENNDTAIMALNDDDVILFVGFFIRDKEKERYRPAEEIIDIYLTEDEYIDDIDPKEIQFFPTLIESVDIIKTHEYMVSKIYNAMALFNCNVAIISHGETHCDVISCEDASSVLSKRIYKAKKETEMEA